MIILISNQNLQGRQYRLFNGADKKFQIVELSTFSNSLHEAIHYLIPTLALIVFVAYNYAAKVEIKSCRFV